MANQKEIRTRIGSVKNTQKITRAMKLVAGARLRKAQENIEALRPYALKTFEVLSGVAARVSPEEELHPLLARREPKKVMLVVLTSARSLAGAFNSNICRAAFNRWKELEAEGLAPRSEEFQKAYPERFKKKLAWFTGEPGKRDSSLQGQLMLAVRKLDWSNQQVVTAWQKALRKARELDALIAIAHREAGIAAHASIALPSAMWAEVHGTVTNRQGRVQPRAHAEGEIGAYADAEIPVG